MRGSRDIYGREHGPMEVCDDDDLVPRIRTVYPKAHLERSTFDMGTIWNDKECVGSFWRCSTIEYAYRLKPVVVT